MADRESRGFVACDVSASNWRLGVACWFGMHLTVLQLWMLSFKLWMGLGEGGGDDNEKLSCFAKLGVTLMTASILNSF